MNPHDDGLGGHEGLGSHPDLVALTRHELSNADALAAGEHTGGCDTCRDELTELVVGAAVIGRAARTLQETLGPAPAGAVGRAAGAGAVGAVGGVDLPPLPPLPRPRARRTPVGGRWVPVAAAAVAVVVGVLAALALGPAGDRDALPERAGGASLAPAVPTRSVALGPVEAGATTGPSGRVTLATGDAATTLTFVTDDLPEVAGDEFYEAWLLDPATAKMLPLGVVREGTAATFEVATTLLDRYGALDLSLESDDGDPQHSAVSVLRGTL
jgi:hypothetical protein